MTIEQIKEANKAAGWHFFEPATLRFFKSRVLDDVFEGKGGVFFVTSEQFEFRGKRGPRRYTVRKFDPASGRINTIGKYQAYRTAATAERAAAALTKGVVAPVEA